MELHELEERKNKHINELIQNHQRAFENMRTYYNSITKDNVDMIKLLQVRAISGFSGSSIFEIGFFLFSFLGFFFGACGAQNQIGELKVKQMESQKDIDEISKKN